MINANMWAQNTLLFKLNYIAAVNYLVIFIFILQSLLSINIWKLELIFQVQTYKTYLLLLHFKKFSVGLRELEGNSIFGS